MNTSNSKLNILSLKYVGASSLWHNIVRRTYIAVTLTILFMMLIEYLMYFYPISTHLVARQDITTLDLVANPIVERYIDCPSIVPYHVCTY